VFVSHQDIIIAAIPLALDRQKTAQASGNPNHPDAAYTFEELVRQEAVRITAMCAPKSAADRAISQIEEAFVLNDRQKPQGVVVGDIVGAVKDPHTNRVVVTYRPTHQGNHVDENGNESITTEPIYKEDGLATANLARSLIGHRVMILKNVETFTDKKGNTKKGKVARYFVDLGIPG
jgi:hypothetical protein